MARLFDMVDVRHVANAINSAGPDSISQRADLIVLAAFQAMVMPSDLEKAIERWKAAEAQSIA